LTENSQSTYKTTYKAVSQRIENAIVESTTWAYFRDSFKGESGMHFFNTRSRETAVMLDTLIQVNPANPFIPKLVKGLMAARNHGNYWYNTMDNAFVFIALDRYFQTFENIEPSYFVDMWIGKGYIGRTNHENYSTKTETLKVPMQAITNSDVIKDGDKSIVMSKRGQGRLYYRVALQYAPLELFLPPVDNGFAVTREYTHIDNEKDVTVSEHEGKKLYTIKAGVRVKVNLKVTTPATRTHLALVDYLPAGLEAINPALDSSGRGFYSYRSWFRIWDHSNFRDSRVEAFAARAYAGVYTYSYTARAVTLGTYISPPAKTEEMYAPEVFGRSDMVLVKIIGK